ncbi:MAG: N-acetylneuraminate synthase [Candidatus Omnitrophica bacterium]|nr:N-acetylneuraminate synthase [Candidatus Omnitrophota bacterium]
MNVDIAGHRVGLGHRCVIIAEAGVNHNGSIETARRLVDAAVDVGADAVKFQAFSAQRLVAASAPKAAYQARTTGAGESQLAMLTRLELSARDHQDLFAYCRQRGIMYLCTPFDEASADFLAELGVAAFKLPSGELTNLPLLAHVARKGRPILVSTGMATLAEVRSAVEAIRQAGNPPLILLHAVSSYPADAADANLRAMQTMGDVFGVPVGYSDHTLGIEVALAAVALGACVIEKHVTLDRTLPGPDHRASLEPHEFASLVRGIRTVEASLGHGRKEPAASEANTAAVARKSLVAARPIARGSVVTADAVAIKRPGTGLAPTELSRIVGKIAAEDIPADALFTLEMLT